MSMPTPPPSAAPLPPAHPQTLHPYIHLQYFRGRPPLYPSQTPGRLRHLVRWDDDAHSPVLAMVVVHRTARETVVITTTATADGVSTLAGLFPELGAATDPDLTALVPGPADVEVLLSAHATLGPLIEGRWDATHRDTILVTEQNMWSVHQHDGPDDPDGRAS